MQFKDRRLSVMLSLPLFVFLGYWFISDWILVPHPFRLVL